MDKLTAIEKAMADLRAAGIDARLSQMWGAGHYPTIALTNVTVEELLKTPKAEDVKHE